MYQYLADYSGYSSGLSSGFPWLAVVAIAVVGSFVIPMTVRQLRKIRGPVVRGTAKVLSLRQFGSMAVNGPERMVCRVRLTADVPGREPYDTTVWQNIAPWDLGAMSPGDTVVVEASADKPGRVRILGPAPPKVVAGHDFSHDAGSSVLSAAGLLASGQRVPGVLKSFAPTGTTPRSLGRLASHPDLLDAPHYLVEVEFHFPNLAPVTGRAVQAVPRAQVPRLTIGLELPCAVDPADPTRRFAVDWAAAPER